MEFVGHICFWHVCGNNMWSRCCSWLHLVHICADIRSVCPYRMRPMWVIFTMWQPYGLVMYGNNMKCSLGGNCRVPWSHVWYWWLDICHVYARTFIPPYMPCDNMVYVCNMACIFVSCTYIEITWSRCCNWWFWHIYAPLSDVYANTQN